MNFIIKILFNIIFPNLLKMIIVFLFQFYKIHKLLLALTFKNILFIFRNNFF